MHTQTTAPAIEAAQVAVDQLWDARRAYRDSGDVEALIEALCVTVGHLEVIHETIANPDLGPSALVRLP